jgi:hypothetical protein
MEALLMRMTTLAAIACVTLTVAAIPADAEDAPCVNTLTNLKAALDADVGNSTPSSAVVQATINSGAACGPGVGGTATTGPSDPYCAYGYENVGKRDEYLRFDVPLSGVTYNYTYHTGAATADVAWNAYLQFYRTSTLYEFFFKADGRGLDGYIVVGGGGILPTYFYGPSGLGEMKCLSPGASAPGKASGWARYESVFRMQAWGGFADC